MTVEYLTELIEKTGLIIFELFLILIIVAIVVGAFCGAVYLARHYWKEIWRGE